MSTKTHPYGSEAADPQQALLEGLKAGESEAYEQLLAEYQDKIYRLAWRMTRNDADAEEVVQNVFLQIFRKIDTFEGNSALSTWIYRVTSNAALMLLRSRKKNTDSLEDAFPRYSEDGHVEDPEPSWGDLPEERFLSDEALGKVDDAVAKLAPEYRAVFVLRDVEGQSTEEVAEALGLSVSAVKSRLHRARMFLRKRLGDYFAVQVSK